MYYKIKTVRNIAKSFNIKKYIYVYANTRNVAILQIKILTTEIIVIDVNFPFSSNYGDDLLEKTIM